MDDKYSSNAYTQAYVIVNYLLEMGEIIVPENLIKTLEDKRNIEYKFDLNDLKNIQLHPDTEKILTIVYLECIANSDEKKKIIKSIKYLRKTIIKEDLDKENSIECLPMDVNSLKWIDKIKIKINAIGFLSKRLNERGVL